MHMYMYTVYAYVRVHIYIIIYISTAILGETRTFRKLSLIIKPWKYTEINKMLMLKDGHKMCWGNIYIYIYIYSVRRSSPPEVLSWKPPTPPPQKKKICRIFTGEHPHWNATPTKQPCSFIEVTLQRGHSPTNLPHKSPKTPSHKSTSKGLRPHIFKNPN